MTITVFANSTLYTPMPNITTTGGIGTMDLLQEAYPDKITGLWNNGLTVLNVRKNLPLYLKERHARNWIILNLGAVECYTAPALSFLQWAMHYLFYYGHDEYFACYVLPRAFRAAQEVNGNASPQSYYRLMTPEDYGNIYNQILKLLEGFSVISIGINKPAFNDHRLEQATEYNEVIKKIDSQFNHIRHIDCWNLLDKYVVDTTHMTEEGNKILFDIIHSIIEGKV